MPGQALAGSAAAACAAVAAAGSSRQRRQKSAQSAKRVAAKSASLSARSAPPAALRGAGRRLERRAGVSRRCRAEHDAGGAFPAAAESHASSPPAAGAPCCGAGCSEPPSADGAHSHAHSHAHAHGDEAHLQAGLSHGHTHGGDEALRQGGGNPVQRALAAFFRLCGLMQLAGLLRNSLPVISAAWVCLVRAPAARPRNARLPSDARACHAASRPRCGGVGFALRRCRLAQVVAGCAGAASHFALVPAASASVLASAATAVVYLLVGLPEARPAFASFRPLLARHDSTLIRVHFSDVFFPASAVSGRVV